MTVRVKRGLLTRIRTYPDMIAIQVSGPSPELIRDALQRARIDIANLDGAWRSMPNLGPGDRNDPKWVSPVLPTPDGGVIRIDGGYTPYRLLRGIPEIIASRLAEAGVDEATISQPRYGAMLRAVRAAAVVLRLYPPPPRSRQTASLVPIEWLARGCAWLAAGGAGEPLIGAVDAVEYPLGEIDEVAFLRECQSAEANWAAVISGDWRTRVRAVAASFATHGAALILSAGGPDNTEEDARAVFDEFRAVGRSLASGISYGLIAVDPNFASAQGNEAYAWVVEGGKQATPGTFGECVPDAFPWQILGPGHLARLGQAPVGAHHLDASKVELSIGAFEDWWLGEPPAEPDPSMWHVRAWRDNLSARRRDPTIQHRARERLRPLMTGLDETRAASPAPQ